MVLAPRESAGDGRRIMDPGRRALLRRRVGAAPATPSGLTPTRALRLAMTRAAQMSIGLSLTVLGIAEEVGPLDDLLGRLEPGLLMLKLAGPEGPVGFLALDPEARAAAVETQTLGRVAARPAPPRPPTRTDEALAEPMLSAFLREAEAALAGTALGGWPGPAILAGALAGLRDVAMALADGTYRAVRLTLDLGVGGRQGLVLLLARVGPAPPAATPPPGWAEALRATVLGAEASLEAVLHRLRLPLEALEGLASGDLLPLPGVTVASVRLIGPGGVELGPARLGQLGGLRAVRLEAAPRATPDDQAPPRLVVTP
jgi:flagellar motor switch protein FliM